LEFIVILARCRNGIIGMKNNNDTGIQSVAQHHLDITSSTN